jgi:hypothetical protein
MLGAFGVFGSAVGTVVVLWFFIVGFWVKKLVKEQQETNRLLRVLGNASSGVESLPKAS